MIQSITRSMLKGKSPKGIRVLELSIKDFKKIKEANPEMRGVPVYFCRVKVLDGLAEAKVFFPELNKDVVLLETGE